MLGNEENGEVEEIEEEMQEEEEILEEETQEEEDKQFPATPLFIIGGSVVTVGGGTALYMYNEATQKFINSLISKLKALFGK
ncbi:hypothetical protein E2L07_19270 [Halalkalibacterium halodurans]|nr:hypothetical protein E2L07_19270 [Halalkalibacterium halodurans]